AVKTTIISPANSGCSRIHASISNPESFGNRRSNSIRNGIGYRLRSPRAPSPERYLMASSPSFTTLSGLEMLAFRRARFSDRISSSSSSTNRMEESRKSAEGIFVSKHIMTQTRHHFQRSNSPRHLRFDSDPIALSRLTASRGTLAGAWRIQDWSADTAVRAPILNPPRALAHAETF